MKTYLQPKSEIFELISTQHLLQASDVHREGGSGQLTRQQEETQRGLGTGLWEDMK